MANTWPRHQTAYRSDHLDFVWACLAFTKIRITTCSRGLNLRGINLGLTWLVSQTKVIGIT